MTLTAQELQSENKRVAEEAKKAADTKKGQDLQAAFAQSIGVAGRDAGTFLIKGIKAKPEEMMMLGFKILDSFTKSAKAGIDFALFADKNQDLFTKPKKNKADENPEISTGGTSAGPSGGGLGSSKMGIQREQLPVAAAPQMM